MSVKRFDQAGVGTLLQFGKRGPKLQQIGGLFSVVDSTGSTLVRFQVASPIAADDAITLSYLNSQVTNLNLGTMAIQNANNVAITGGRIDGTPIGNNVPSTLTGTLLTAEGNTNNIVIAGSTSSVAVSISASGGDSNVGINFIPKGSSGISVNSQILTDSNNNVPVARLNSATNANLNTFWRGDGQWSVPPPTLGAGEFYAEQPSNKVYPVLSSAPRALIIMTLYGKVSFGGTTLTALINGNPITGLSNLGITTVGASYIATANFAMNAGDRLSVQLTGTISGTSDLEVTIQARTQ